MDTLVATSSEEVLHFDTRRADVVEDLGELDAQLGGVAAHSKFLWKPAQKLCSSRQH